MNDNLQEGDSVRHKIPTINGGLPMSVSEINNDRTQAKCSHFLGSEATHKEDWFDFSDLTLVSKIDGGFF